jgi:hypothetical protein
VITLYALAASGGSYIGPLWQGFMANDMGNWRWIMRWGSIFCGLLLFLFFFFHEESLFYRKGGHREMDVVHMVHVQATPTEKGTEVNGASDVPDAERVPAKTAPIRSRLALWHNFPVSWGVVGRKIVAAVTGMTYPAIFWVGSRC